MELRLINLVNYAEIVVSRREGINFDINNNIIIINFPSSENIGADLSEVQC
jgi:hypothetical protein